MIKTYWIVIIVVVLALAGYVYFGRDAVPTYEFITAERGELIQEVSVTGRVKPAEKVDLAFEKAGKVSRVNVDVGDRVQAGEILVALNSSALTAELAEAEADVKVQKAKLDELRRGTREEEIRVQEVKVANAKVALEDAKKNLVDKINDAYTKSDDAIRNKVDQFFVSPRGSDPQLDFSVSDSKLERSLEGGRLSIESVLVLWRSSLDALTASGDLAEYTAQAQANLNQTKSFLNDAALALSTLSTSVTISQTTIDGYRSDVSTARTNVNTAIVNLSTADEKLRAAESSLALAEEELILKRAGTIEEQINAQVAKVEQVEATVLTKRAALAKTFLRSPIRGVVTRQDARVGEIAAANTALASVISEILFEIEMNVPEADVAKLSIGDPAKITLDAYGSNVFFEAVVVTIDPAETILEGVATYTTTLQFVGADDRIKSGMTANTDIRTDERQNVIAVPRRAVITKNGDTLVRILENDAIKEVLVTTGLRGSDGRVEITSGISEGDRVIVFLEEE